MQNHKLDGALLVSINEVGQDVLANSTVVTNQSDDGRHSIVSWCIVVKEEAVVLGS